LLATGSRGGRVEIVKEFFQDGELVALLGDGGAESAKSKGKLEEGLDDHDLLDKDLGDTFAATLSALA
jgi:hypothetical protein